MKSRMWAVCTLIILTMPLTLQCLLLLVCDWPLESHGAVVYACLTDICTWEEFEQQSLDFSYELQILDIQVRRVTVAGYFCGNKNTQGTIPASPAHIKALGPGLF